MDLVRVTRGAVFIRGGRRLLNGGVRYLMFRHLEGPSDHVLNCPSFAFSGNCVNSIRVLHAAWRVEVRHDAHSFLRVKDGTTNVEMDATGSDVSVFSLARRGDLAASNGARFARFNGRIQVGDYVSLPVKVFMTILHVFASAHWCIFFAARLFSSFPYALFFFRVSLGSSPTGLKDSHPFPRTSGSLCFVGHNG